MTGELKMCRSLPHLDIAIAIRFLMSYCWRPSAANSVPRYLKTKTFSSSSAAAAEHRLPVALRVLHFAHLDRVVCEAVLEVLLASLPKDMLVWRRW